MKRKKFKSIKQKIMVIPIIAVMLISFVMPNYTHAASILGFLNDQSNKVFQTFIDLLVLIPDSILVGMQDAFVTETSYGDLVTTVESADHKTVDDLQKEIPWTGIIAQNIVAPGSGVLTALFKLGLTVGNEVGNRDETSVDISNIKISPMSIFANIIPALNVNIFSNKSYTNGNKDSIVGSLRNIVATWYYTLRNIALVLMLIVLVVVGIRITVSSVASEKAKYKQYLIDWFVAIILLMFMHYIMVFSVNVVEMFTNAIMYSDAKKVTKENLVYYSDPLINKARQKAGEKIDANAADDTGDVSGAEVLYWAIIYFVLVLFLLIFIIQYLIRLIRLVFLTLIAPILAFFYPIDKMMDGKSQGFDRWIKDYIFTLMIQPIHLILYTILISSVLSLSTAYPLYALVVLGCFIPMEKMVREFLGFERGHLKGPSTAGILAATAAGQRLARGFKGIGKNRGNGTGGNGKIDANGENSNNPQINTNRRGTNPYEGYILGAGANDPNQQDESQGRNNRNNNNDDDYIDTSNNEEWDGIGSDGNSEQFQYDNAGNPIDYGQNDEDNNQEDNNQEDNNHEDNNQEDNNQEETNNEGNNGSKVWRGVKGAGRFLSGGARSLRARSGGKDGVIRGLKTGARIVGATTLGAAGATIGLAAGIASGDLSSVGKLTLGGAAGGAYLGNGLAGFATNNVPGFIGNVASNAAGIGKDAYDNARYGNNPEEYQRILKERKERQEAKEIKKEIEKRKKNSELHKKMIQKAAANDKERNECIEKCTEEGLNDDQTVKVMEFHKNGGLNYSQAISTVKLADSVKGKSTQDIKDTLTTNFKNNNIHNWSDERINNEVNKAVRLIGMAKGNEKISRI